MKKILRILYLPYQWLFLVPFSFLLTIFFGSTAVALAFVTNPRIASFFGGVIWARIISFLTPMVVSVTGREHINKQQSYVIISNHQSVYDIFLLYGWLGIDAKWVMKKELRKVPGLGIGSEKVGHIFIDRSNSKAAIASINEAKKKIMNGTSVIFFPEGTRKNNTTELGSFKKGAFKLAIDLELPILPITIVGTKDILPVGTTRIFPGKAKLIIHPAISTERYDDSNMEELIYNAREVIRAELDKSLSYPSKGEN